MSYTKKEIAKMYDHSYATTKRHIQLLEKQKKFKRTSIGRYYNDQDVKALGNLLGFKPTKS